MLREAAMKRERDFASARDHCAREYEQYVLKHTGDQYQASMCKYMAIQDMQSLHALTKEHLKPFEKAAKEEHEVAIKKNKNALAQASTHQPSRMQTREES